MSVRLICVGDIHLGRVPPLPIGREGEAILPCPALAWERTVDFAVDGEVDAVLLAGDVVDDVSDRFEAIPKLRRGAEKLAEAGVELVAVAGNHDVEAMPRLASLIPGMLTLLGPDGTWSDVVIKGRSGEAIRVVGWSFPRSKGGRHSGNPLDGFKTPLDDMPAVGLLHADLDASGGAYAPVPRSEIEAIGLSAWFLGHIHKPDDLSAMRRPLGYLGSLCGLDSTETGPHGPWLAEVHPGGRVSMSHIPISPLRWETLEVDVSDISPDSSDDAADEIVAAVGEEISARLADLKSELDESAVAVVSFDISLVGRSPSHTAIVEALERNVEGVLESCSVNSDGVRIVVRKIKDRSLPALAVAEIAKGVDAAAILARDILALENRAPEMEQLLATARTSVPLKVHSSLRRSVDAEIQDDESLRAHLLAAAYDLLERLLAEKDVEGMR